VPSQYYLGIAMVDTKTNEIPVARQLFKKLDLADAKSVWTLFTLRTRLARQLVLETAAGLLLTC